MNYEPLEILSFMYQLKPHRENLKTIFHLVELGDWKLFQFFFFKQLLQVRGGARIDGFRKKRLKNRVQSTQICQVK